jgi:hypothetical protein
MLFELVDSLIRILAHPALDAKSEMHLFDVTPDISSLGETSATQRAWVTPSTALAFLSCRRGVGEMWVV